MRKDRALERDQRSPRHLQRIKWILMYDMLSKYFNPTFGVGQLLSEQHRLSVLP